MAYDALGRRCRKSVDGRRTFFAWDGDALLAEQFEDQPAREYVYYPGTFEPLALIDADGQVYYYHNDPNGLPQELTRPNGEPVWSAVYDTHGRITGLLEDQIAQPLRLQGQYFDPEVDLCYNRHRYFDPHTCSFISQDPLGLAAGENVYAYAPNVFSWVDPLGLCKKSSNSPITDPNRMLPAPTDSNPWMDGASLKSDVVGDEGMTVYRAHGSGRKTGGWVTSNPPPNQQYVRKDLAVHPDWNEATHVSKIKLAPGTRIQSGIAGPQDFPGGTGGGHQIQVLNFSDILKQEVIETSTLPK